MSRHGPICARPPASPILRDCVTERGVPVESPGPAPSTDHPGLRGRRNAPEPVGWRLAHIIGELFRRTRTSSWLVRPARNVCTARRCSAYIMAWTLPTSCARLHDAYGRPRRSALTERPWISWVCGRPGRYGTIVYRGVDRAASPGGGSQRGDFGPCARDGPSTCTRSRNRHQERCRRDRTWCRGDGARRRCITRGAWRNIRGAAMRYERRTRQSCRDADRGARAARSRACTTNAMTVDGRRSRASRGCR